MRVYRFLNEEFGLKALKERRIKISRIHELNDPFEWAAPAGADARHRHAFNVTKLKMSQNRGLICVSRSWRNPLLWSHYADHHKGLCLGFDVPEGEFDAVAYLQNKIPCNWGRWESDQFYQEFIMKQVILTKFDHWKYESELRCFVKLDQSDDKGLFFSDFSDDFRLTEVIVGSTSSLSRSQLADALGNLAGEVHCRKARLAFKSFGVVEQQKSSLWP